MKTIVFFIALLLSIFFVNDKFSKGVRVIAFSEGETENSGKISFILMVVVAIAWTLFFAIS
jgi:hypothetical protein